MLGNCPILNRISFILFCLLAPILMLIESIPVYLFGLIDFYKKVPECWAAIKQWEDNHLEGGL